MSKSASKKNPPPPRRCWSITLNPPQGVDDAMCERFIKWLKKPSTHCLGAFVVTEKTGTERHIHAQVYFGKPKIKCAVQKSCICIQDCKDHYEEHVLKEGFEIGYSDDFYKNYLTKDLEGDTIIIYNEVPDEDVRIACYPSAEEQAETQARSRCVDTGMYNWEKRWLEEYADNGGTFTMPDDHKKRDEWLYHQRPAYRKGQKKKTTYGRVSVGIYEDDGTVEHRDVTREHIAEMMFDAMFVKRTVPVVKCPRKRKELMLSVWAYIAKPTNMAKAMFGLAKC